MPSIIEKYGLERAAAAKADEAGEDWYAMSQEEKQKYYAMVKRDVGPSFRNNGDASMPVNDEYRRPKR